jgi:hypothetical protein
MYRHHMCTPSVVAGAALLHEGLNWTELYRVCALSLRASFAVSLATYSTAERSRKKKHGSTTVQQR